MANEKLAKLQATLNRFSSAAGILRIAVDGGMGDQTFQAAQFVTQYVIVNITPGGFFSSGFGEADMEDLRRLDATAFQSQTAFMQSAVQLDDLLTAAANQEGYPPPEKIKLIAPVDGSGVPNRNAFAIKPAPTGTAASLMIMWNKLPAWGKIGLGAAGAFGVLFLATKKPTKALAGRR